MVSRHLREDPESVCKGLDVVTETLIELCGELKKAGADGIYYAALGGEAYRFTEDVFTSYVKKYDSMVIDGINDTGAISILHICKDKIFDDRTGILVEGTKEEILAETDRIVKEAGRDKLIIGSDCTLPGDIEPWSPLFCPCMDYGS